MRAKIGILFLFTCTLLSAQNLSLSDLQANESGKRIIWFLTTLKSGNDVGANEIREQFSPKLIDKVGIEDLIGMMKGLKDDQGYLSMYRARRKNGNEIKLLVKGDITNEWYDMVFYFEKESPNRMVGFTIDSNDLGSEGEAIFPLNN